MPVTLRIKILLTAMLMLPCSAAAQQDAFSGLHLGFVQCAPAIYFPLQPGTTVKISEITRDDVTVAGVTHTDAGMLKSYKEEITFEGRSPILLTVTVDLSKWTGNCSSLVYNVDIGGRTRTSSADSAFLSTRLPKTIAFSPEANAGVLLGGGALEGSVDTLVAYDPQRRKYISRQTFGSGGAKFEVSYTDYGWNALARINAFTAKVNLQAR